MTKSAAREKTNRAGNGKTGPEREWQGDDRESVADPSKARESEQEENDLGDRAGMPVTPVPDAPSRGTPDSGANTPAAAAISPVRSQGIERESA